MFDVAIVGSGPAGASCAAFCAQAGARTLLLEREKFPREKVCGDCLNPACWPVLRRMNAAEAVRALPHGNLSRVDFISVKGRILSVPLPSGEGAEIAIKRSFLDQALLSQARQAGAEVREQVTVNALTAPETASQNWTITAKAEQFQARALVAADGRNSTVARLCKLLPRVAKERIALQTHIPLPDDFGDRIVLQLRPEGYSGQAPVGEAQLNLCLVSEPPHMPSLRSWAESHFAIPAAHQWRTVTPLRRASLPAAGRRLFLIGDAARVVEPFTGEGIYYALASGELAASAITSFIKGADEAEVLQSYSAAHRKLFRGRLWVNRLARAAVLSPRTASIMMEAVPPAFLRFLTAKIVR